MLDLKDEITSLFDIRIGAIPNAAAGMPRTDRNFDTATGVTEMAIDATKLTPSHTFVWS